MVAVPNLPPNPNFPASGPRYADSNLIISSMGLMFFQARDLTQGYSIIEAASDQERDVNYSLVDCSNPAAQQYATTISCTDRRPPPFGLLWPGQIVSIRCAVPHCVPENQEPARDYVSGSEIFEAGFLYYLPILDMMIRSISWQGKEWRADIGWNFRAEEYQSFGG
jgi:hypothetical protein